MSGERPLNHRAAALADLFLAVALVLFAGIVAPLTAQALFPDGNLVPVVIGQGVVVLGGLVLLARWRGLSFAGLGVVALGGRDLLRAVKLLALIFVLNMLLRLAVMQLAPEAVGGQMERLTELGGRVAAGLSLPALLGLSLFIGFYEELLARGFLLQRARALLGGWWGPVALSSLLFGLGHAYQGAFGVLQTTLVGAVLAAAVLRYGTLWPAIIAHALVNAISLWLLSAM
ncbi:CPBP family intramembrane glutamic endopeptidase [Arhodomonas sp. SL1]|uniref:CPBP family intramembrane glutamic endopeptidase n=1 Tax=Arhodomonas sp. SL1 TaxID=3425691 RepID=UPI003F881626